jgi:ABC-type cobalamin/Fe3+-siderophores transport system ATPase subunit
MKRKPYVIVIVGFPGCGKTTLAKEIIKKTLKGRKLFIVDPSGNFGIKEFLVYKINKPETLNNANVVRDGILFVDDYRAFDSSADGKIIQSVARMRRHRKLDIIVVYHSIYNVHPSLWFFATDLICFRTNDIFEKIKKRVPFMGEKALDIIRKLPNYKFKHIKVDQ